MIFFRQNCAEIYRTNKCVSNRPECFLFRMLHFQISTAVFYNPPSHFICSLFVCSRIFPIHSVDLRASGPLSCHVQMFEVPGCACQKEKTLGKSIRSAFNAIYLRCHKKSETKALFPKKSSLSKNQNIYRTLKTKENPETWWFEIYL